MAEHKALQKALRQMAIGSKSGFHTFYLGSVQYIYSSAMLLYHSHEDACRFMVDFYQYLYLHLPEYDRSQDLEKWISRLLFERYTQLSIGKNLPKFSPKQQMDAGTALLSKSERERIWRMLDVHIHFPKEPLRHGKGRIALLVSLLVLLLLLSGRYIPDIMNRIQTAVSVSDENASDAQEADDVQENTPDQGDDKMQDEMETLKDELDERLSRPAGPETSSAANDDALTQEQNPKDPVTEEQPQTPDLPDTPQTPDIPEVPKTPDTTIPSSSDNRTNTNNLEDLELELHYGDSLLFTDSD